MRCFFTGLFVLLFCTTGVQATTIIPREIPVLPTQYFEVSLTGKDTNIYNGSNGAFFSGRLVTLGATFRKDGPDEPFVLFYFMQSSIGDANFSRGNISIFLGSCEGQPLMYMNLAPPTAFEFTEKGCFDFGFIGHPKDDAHNEFGERYQITIVD